MEILIRIASFCFDLKPQDFSMLQDVNKATSEAQLAASHTEAQMPITSLVAEMINGSLMHNYSQVSGDQNIALLEFFWMEQDLDRRKKQSEIDRTYLRFDAFTVDELRAGQDKRPLPNGLGKIPRSVLIEMSKQNPLLVLQLLSPETKSVVDDFLNDIEMLVDTGGEEGEEGESRLAIEAVHLASKEYLRG